MYVVGQEVLEKVLGELRITREKRRQIQMLSRQDLQRYLIRLYKLGYEDGINAVEGRLGTERDIRQKEDAEEEVKVDWDDVLKLIGEVRGIGKKLTEAIDKKLKEAMG